MGLLLPVIKIVSSSGFKYWCYSLKMVVISRDVEEKILHHYIYFICASFNKKYISVQGKNNGKLYSPISGLKFLYSCVYLVKIYRNQWQAVVNKNL
jgi:hypothetical protein